MKKRYMAWVDSAPVTDKNSFMTGHGFVVLISVSVIAVIPKTFIAAIVAAIMGSPAPFGIVLVL